MSATRRYDVVVLGAGHNGLTAAAYLARAGRRVVVLEASDRVGGALAHTEVAGREAPLAFASADALHPGVVKDLDLGTHGLRLQDGSGTLVLGGEAPLWLPADDPGRDLDPADRDGLAELQRLVRRAGEALEPFLAGELPDLERHGLGDLYELLLAGLRLRRLGRRDMPEVLRLLPMTLRDLTEEHLTDPRLRAAVAAPALRGTWLGPWSAGGGYALLHHRPAWRSGLLAPPRFVDGGPAALAAALAKSAEQGGAEIRKGSAVERIHVERGRVTGVTVADGERLDADAVLSTTDPSTTLLDLLEPGWLDPRARRASRNIRYRATVATARFALGDWPDLPVGDARHGRVQIGADLPTLEQAFDPAKYDEIPGRPAIELTFHESPAGPVAHAWIQHVSAGATATDEGRAALLRNVRSTIEAVLPGFGARVEADDLNTANDFATRLGLRGGHLYHGELGLDQALFMRPIPGMYRHATPLAGLYLGGSGTHPGGGINALPGKLAATRILEARGN